MRSRPNPQALRGTPSTLGHPDLLLRIISAAPGSLGPPPIPRPPHTSSHKPQGPARRTNPLSACVNEPPLNQPRLPTSAWHVKEKNPPMCRPCLNPSLSRGFLWDLIEIAACLCRGACNPSAVEVKASCLGYGRGPRPGQASLSYIENELLLNKTKPKT